MIATALRKIEWDLLALVLDATREHPIEPHEVWVLAKRLGCQAEMLEKEIAE